LVTRDALKPPAGGMHNRDSPMSQPLSPHGGGGMDHSNFNNEVGCGDV